MLHLLRQTCMGHHATTHFGGRTHLFKMCRLVTPKTQRLPPLDGSPFWHILRR